MPWRVDLYAHLPFDFPLEDRHESLEEMNDVESLEEMNPSQQDPVLWQQQTNSHGLQKSCGDKGMVPPLSK